MMKSIKYGLVLIMIWSCNKPDNDTVYNPPEKPTSILETVWERTMLIKDGHFDAYSHQPVVYKKNVLFSNSIDGAYHMFDGKTGSKKWVFDSWLNYPFPEIRNNQNLFQNYFAYKSAHELGVIDLETGQAVWQYLDPNRHLFPRITVVGTDLYYKRVDHNFPNWVQLEKSSIYQKNLKKVLRLHIDSLGGYSPSIEGPSLWMNPQGDSVLLFQNRQWDFPNGDGKIDFMGYNTRTKQYDIFLEDIEPNGNSNVMPPLVDGNRAYMLGGRQLHCIDLVNDSIIWQQQFLGAFHHVQIGHIVIHNDKIVVKDDDDAMLCYNKYDGTTIWSLKDLGFDPSHMVLSDGIAYCTSAGNLVAVEVESGTVLWNEESPNEKGSFNHGVGVDPVNGHVFAQDHKSFYCFKVPKKK